MNLGRSRIQQRQEIFDTLGIELSQLGHDCANQVYNGIYQNFTSFCLNSPDSPAVPVASVLELLTKLIQNEKIGLKDVKNVPECEWMVARHLLPKDITVGNLRVWNDLEHTTLIEALSWICSEFVCLACDCDSTAHFSA